MKGQGGVKKFKQMNLRDTELDEDESVCIGLKDIVVGAWFRARSEGGVTLVCVRVWALSPAVGFVA